MIIDLSILIQFLYVSKCTFHFLLDSHYLADNYSLPGDKVQQATTSKAPLDPKCRLLASHIVDLKFIRLNVNFFM